MDYRSGEVNWSMPLQYQAIGSVYRSSNGSYIAAADSFAVQILTESGEPHLSLPLPDSTGGYITGLCWSPDDSQIAVKLKISGAQQERAGIFNMETSAFTLLDPEYQHIIQFCFDKEGTFYLLGTVQEGEHSKEGITTILVPNRYELSAFCGETLQWSTQIEEKNLTDSVSLTTTAKKEWTDESFIRTHDAIYMGVYNGNTLVPGTLREYTASTKSLYWYLDHLNGAFADYNVREVDVQGAVVDSNGYVTSYTSADPLDAGDSINISGVTASGRPFSTRAAPRITSARSSAYLPSSVRVAGVPQPVPMRVIFIAFSLITDISLISDISRVPGFDLTLSYFLCLLLLTRKHL